MIQRPRNGGPDEFHTRSIGDESGAKTEVDLRTMKRKSTWNGSWKEWEKLPNSQKKPEFYMTRNGAASVLRP